MFIAKFLNNMYKNIDRRYAEGSLDLKTTALFYLALNNIR